MVLRRWSLILTAGQVTNEFKQWSSVQQAFYNCRPVVALWPPVAACGHGKGVWAERRNGRFKGYSGGRISRAPL